MHQSAALERRSFFVPRFTQGENRRRVSGRLRRTARDLCDCLNKFARNAIHLDEPQMNDGNLATLMNPT
jgi:hypothetical protein